MTFMQEIFSVYNLNPQNHSVKVIGDGLINMTWLLKNGEEDYILQKVNTDIFKNPLLISENVRRIAKYLKEHYPDYLFSYPVKTVKGNDVVNIEGKGWFRLAEYVRDSHAVSTACNPNLAFEAARQFGRFAKLLAPFPAKTLNITLRDFHNLPLRYEQFLEAIKNGDPKRIEQSSYLIAYLESQKNIVDFYKKLAKDPRWKLRVTHHDTKISNVLFDQNDKGICVIDLDTIMPGYFISDVGDMLRTYLSPVSEEEKDFSKIQIRYDYFEAVWKGYMDEMKDELTSSEKKGFLYAGRFMIYMQALRFLTDHLNHDVYYGAKYQGHNWIRAGNQAKLLREFISAEPGLKKIIDKQSA